MTDAADGSGAVIPVLGTALARLVSPRTAVPIVGWVVLVLSHGVLAESLLRVGGVEEWRRALPSGTLPLGVLDPGSTAPFALAVLVSFSLVTPLTVATLVRAAGPTPSRALGCAPAFLGAWVAFVLTVLAGLVLFVVPGVLVASLWLLWMPVVAVEGVSPVEGLRRGWRLARDRRLAVLGSVWLAVPVGGVLAAPFAWAALVLAPRRPLLARAVGSFGVSLAVCYGLSVVAVWYDQLTRTRDSVTSRV